MGLGISIEEYLLRAKKVAHKPELRKIVYEIILAHEDELKELKYEEYKVGNINSNGTRHRYKNPRYEKFKKDKNPLAGGFVDLILTEHFVESMWVKKSSLKEGAFTFGNRNIKKRRPLMEKYGDDFGGIFGLEQKTFDKFQIDIIMPILRAEIKRRYNIG